MSSFKRRALSKQVTLLSGTRTCPISISTVLTSSGIPSLDDILGGGVPLSCLLAVLAPDPHSAYGELVQKYFVAQGIANGHKVCVVHEDALSFVKECMWMPEASSDQPIPLMNEDDAHGGQDKIKIAWRYEQMKKFETTVENSHIENFCAPFDLTCRVSPSMIDEACAAERLVPLSPIIDLAPSMDGLLNRIRHILATTPSNEVVRLCIAALGSPVWGLGEHCSADVLRFLHTLRRLLRLYPHACACAFLPSQLSTDRWAGFGWTQKVGWATDATISMLAFGANPALSALFPSHHGLVQISKLPAPHSILPTSDRYSTLRGLWSSAAANIGTGENNLAFKCTRRRLVFETMHLDLEGGITERRTTPSSTVIGSDATPIHTHVSDKGSTAEFARVRVELEAASADMKSRHLMEGHANVSYQNTDLGATDPLPKKVKKDKKKVAFHSDKPDLYDF